MADTFGPFDNANMGETGWETILDRLRGVLDDSYLVATASGITSRGVDLSAGSVLHTGYHYTTDTTREVVSSANTSGSPRIDRVVARVDTSANTMLPTVLEGTPAANPSPPTVADTDELLWRWRIEDGATAVSNLRDERTVISGLVTSGVRPAVVHSGHLHHRSGLWEGWNGSSWVTLHEDSGWERVSLRGHWVQSSNPLRVRRIGNIVNLSGRILRGSTFQFLPNFFEQIGQLQSQFRPDHTLVNNVEIPDQSIHWMQCRVLTSGAVEVDLDGQNLATDAPVDINMTWMVQ